MPSPFIRVNADGQIAVDANGKFSADVAAYLNSLQVGSISGPSQIADEPAPVAGTVAVGGSVSGVIDFNGDIDQYTVTLVAGQTYMFSLRGTGATPINDSLLQLINPAGNAFVATDDDGGNDLYSIITYTATESGIYTIRAQTFANADPDIGGYTIDVRQQGADAVGNTNATAAVLSPGTSFGFIETSGDVDRYAVTLTAGQFYTFSLAGGADYATNPDAVPAGELDTILTLRNAAGTILASNDDNSFPSDLSSGLGFYAETSGVYYIDATAYPGQTGGYALAFETIDLSTQNPLDSIDWRSADNVPFVDTDDDGMGDTAYVYFAPAGMHFGETADDGVTHMTTFGWQQHEIDAVMLALEQYEQILGVNYEITNNPAQATFRLMTTSSDNYGAYFYPHDPAYGDAQGIGVFNVDSGGWAAFPQSLEPGGYSFAVILHEFGHAHGLAHPHDNGGGSDVMLGVTGSDSRGIFDLNQGVYTVMSYNDAFETHPDGPSSFTINGIDNGWSATLSAFDIAQLQIRYGVHDANTGDNVYALTDVADNANYQTIWDTGGNDTISYSGSLNAQIDLTAATLDYSATGGGAVSFLNNVLGTPASLQVKGGFTIANDVVIENATGGSGNDVLIGNSANNVLNGGGGSDTVVYKGAAGAVTVDLTLQTATGGGGNDTLVAIESAVGSSFNDTLVGNDADNTLDGGDGDDIMSGGNGIDTASYASVSAGVSVDLTIAGAQNTGGGGIDTLSSFENLTGSRFNDVLTGTAGANVINGGAGNDVMNGGDGIDTASYAGAASAVGVLLSNAAAQNTSGAGVDTLTSFENLTGSNFNDTLGGTSGDNILDGGFGTDRVTYQAALAAVIVNLSLTGAQATGGAGNDTLISFENLTGSNHSDTLTGTAGANDIVGRAGNDTFDGGDGNDVLTGGDGDDNLNGGGGIDTASYAGSAAVTVSLAAVGAQNTVGSGFDTLTSIENLTGSSFGDTLTGDASVNVINGGIGNDTVNGGGGNDVLGGGTGDDIVNGGDGNDAVNGEAGNDTLSGGLGIDTISGGDGNDTLNGDAGHDILIGGAGIDTVSGGDGVDVVTLGAGDDVFKAEVTSTKVDLKAGSMSVDIITDFDASGNDWIDLSGFGQEFTFRGTSNSKNAGDLTYKTYASISSAEAALGFDIDGQAGAGGIGGPVTIVYGNTNGGNADFAIVLLNTGGVDASDFAAAPATTASALAAAASVSGADFADFSSRWFENSMNHSYDALL